MPGDEGGCDGAARRRLLAALAARGMLRDDRATTAWGQPAWRPVRPGHEPQPLMDGTTRQRDLVACAHATPPTGENLCAEWVERAFARLGLGAVSGDASALYMRWCDLSDTRDLLVGMIVAVPAHPFDPGGRAWGHVGLHAGDGVVMDCVARRVRRVPLELWASAYGAMAEPRWGWLGGIALD